MSNSNSNPSSAYNEVHGVDLNMANILKYFSMIAPFLITFFMVMLSLFNANFKGFIYLGGVVVLLMIITLFQNVIKYNPRSRGQVSRICKVFSFPDPIGLYSIPQFSSALYSFTFLYLFAPMLSNSMFNFPLLLSILTFYVIDTVIKVNSNCTNPLGVLFGTIMGLVWGGIFFTILYSYSNADYLYYSDYMSDKVACTRPSNQKFKCKVYKNGELLATI
jgi:hypothetical protein